MYLAYNKGRLMQSISVGGKASAMMSAALTTGTALLSSAKIASCADLPISTSDFKDCIRTEELEDDGVLVTYYNDTLPSSKCGHGAVVECYKKNPQVLRDRDVMIFQDLLEKCYENHGRLTKPEEAGGGTYLVILPS